MANKLCRYNNYNPTTQTIVGEEKPAYYFYDEASIPADYTNINSVENLDSFGFKASNNYDYKKVRDLIKVEVDAIGWGSLTSGQQIIATTHKIGTHNERLSALGGDINMLVALGTQYHGKVYECRQIRMAWAVSCVHNHLEHLMEGSQTVPEFILSNIPAGYIDNYTAQGLGGICDGDNDQALLDYINNTVGTDHADAGSNPGLRTRTWIPEGLTSMNEFCDKLMDILQNGIY